MRIASLVPSGTELIAALGCEPDLVARSHRCNYPDSVLDRPVVTVSRLAEKRRQSPKSIDAAVDDHRHGHKSMFRVLTDTLRDTRPDVLLTQSICEVCAVPESMSIDALDHLDPRPELVTLKAETIEEVFASLLQLGAALGREKHAAQVVDDLRRRVTGILERRPQDRSREPQDPPSRPPLKVACLEWVDPLRHHGLWMPEIIEALGAENGFGRTGEPGGVMAWDDLATYDPDVLIVSPCGRTLAEIQGDMASLTERDGWSDLKAVQNNRVYLLDGEISSRHGPRVVRALELVAHLLYPDVYADIKTAPFEAAAFGPRTI